MIVHVLLIKEDDYKVGWTPQQNKREKNRDDGLLLAAIFAPPLLFLLTGTLVTGFVGGRS